MRPDKKELEELVAYLEDQYMVTPGLARAIEILGMIAGEEIKLVSQLHIGDTMIFSSELLNRIVDGAISHRVEVVDVREGHGDDAGTKIIVLQNKEY